MPFSEEQKRIRCARAAAWNKAHPDRVRQIGRLAYQKRIAAIRAGTKKPSKQDREANRLRVIEWRRAHPWYNIWQGIKQRCGNPKHPRYHRYGGRGIRCILTKGDMQFLWTRDHASEMVEPSIDRIDNDGDYCLDNCQVISKTDNAIKGCKDRNKALFEKLLDGSEYLEN